MKRDIFTPEHAELCRKRVGQKYRPSNGTEGEYFMMVFCNHCKHDGYGTCPIINNSFFYEKDDPQYPAELQYGETGQPICTQFEAIA